MYIDDESSFFIESLLTKIKTAPDFENKIREFSLCFDNWSDAEIDMLFEYIQERR